MKDQLQHDDQCEQLPGGRYYGQTIGGGWDGQQYRDPMPIPCHCAARRSGERKAAREAR